MKPRNCSIALPPLEQRSPGKPQCCSMPRPCSACAHPDRAAVDAALVAGVSFRTVAGRYGLSEGALHRHRTRHVDQPIVGEIMEPDYRTPLWERWDGSEWQSVREPNPADLIELLDRPRHAKYRQGVRLLSAPDPRFRGLGLSSSVMSYVRRVYRASQRRAELTPYDLEEAELRPV